MVHLLWQRVRRLKQQSRRGRGKAKNRLTLVSPGPNSTRYRSASMPRAVWSELAMDKAEAVVESPIRASEQSFILMADVVTRKWAM